MTNDLDKHKKDRDDKDRDRKILLFKKREITKLYKNGYELGEICRKVKLDISTTLLLIKGLKLKKKRLYEVYTNQTVRSKAQHGGLFLKRDEYYLDKFFPKVNSFFSTNYYWYWKDKIKKREKKQDDCKHKIRHIRCSLCDKILGDATYIPLNNNLIAPEASNLIEEEKEF